ncbi:MAG: sulfatase [Planctomycetes bacterium]|nr:sulfatase [Planctomycetota bacterium]
MKKHAWNLVLFVAATLTVAAEATDRPNVLLIMADDCTFNDLTLYGGQNAKTPNLDKLASEGLVFNHAYLSEAMCQPCRSALYSGQYPIRNGAAYNHASSRIGTRSMPQHLRPLGYRVGLAGKVHVKPQASFPFKRVSGFDVNCVRNPTQPHNLDGIRRFMKGDGAKPFCLVVALVEPHVPWVMGDASQYPVTQLTLPPNIADTAVTRQEFAAYLAEITYMDGQVGEILQTLEETGHGNDTLVMFTSEQGAQFPGCKWTNWDTGVHTALVARWPGVVPAGKRTDAIVQYVDVLPTLLELAGGSFEEGQLDGTSFLAVLKGEAQTHRTFAYGVHNNIPEGPPYPIRTVTDGDFRYIRNLAPDELYIEKHMMGSGGLVAMERKYWFTWVLDAWKNERTYNLVKRYQSRPAEQFYHTKEDPFEMKNLADHPAYAGRMERLAGELDRWMASQGDPGAVIDTPDAFQAAKKGNAPFGPKPSLSPRAIKSTYAK